MLEHGGQLRAAAAHYGIPLAEWLDLSTGINPNGWLPASLPADIWQALPQADDGLETAAQAYYRSPRAPLAVAGSQAAIQHLPILRQLLQGRSRVGLLDVGYAEHCQAWQHQHDLQLLPWQSGTTDISQAVTDLDVLLLIQPNNPTGRRFSLMQLLTWHQQLAAHGGWLVVDEAFIDCFADDQSLVSHTDRAGLIVLRSVGKFFGLAGARVGFVFAQQNLLNDLAEQLGPWPISSASRWVVLQALLDQQWQRHTQQQLEHAGLRLQLLLERTGLLPSGGCNLFQWCLNEQAWSIHQALARLGIFTRYFPQPQAIRFGLPATDAQWQRLESGLVDVMKDLTP